MNPTLALLALLSSTSGPLPVAAEPGESVIRICRLELTEAGRQARFRFVYLFSVRTGETGEVVEVRRDERDHPPFVREEEFEPCLRSWRLRPSSEYGVAITVTSSAQNAIAIRGSGDLNLRLLVP